VLFLDALAIRADKRFPLVHSFVAEGASSYLALPVSTARGDIHVLALWTAQPGGWSASDVEQVTQVLPLLSLLAEVSEGRRLIGLVGRRAEQADEALARANAISVAKSRFLGILSHELRTPLHGVLGLGEVLATTDLDTEQTRCVDGLLRTSRELLGTLEGILDFSELDAGGMVFQRVPLQPLQIVTEVVEDLMAQARSRELELTLVCDAGLPARQLGDPARLRQIWTILIGNAIKFTRRGSVRVSLAMDKAADGTALLRGVVSDTGAGIAQEDQATLFEPFTQVDDSLRRRHGGLGLGLAICRLIVAQVGGSLGVESRLGQGSRFFFSLPATACDEVEAVPGAAMPSSRQDSWGDISALRVLVVDDNPVNLLLTERQLRTLGVTSTRVATHGLEALDILADVAPDLVLMDIQLPDMDGREVTRELRQRGLARQPWVTAMTANVSDDDRRACMSAGVDDFLPKPVSLAALRAALQRAASRIDPDACPPPN
jgi:signal transduction histidine kinase/ActR/RegA family two-component response regulator